MLIVGFTIQVSTNCHVPVTKPGEICTKCFEGLVQSNILQGDKMLHFEYFILILILIFIFIFTLIPSTTKG